MQNKKLEKDQKLVESLKGLAQAYEEISVTKMQRVRGKVLSSRDYLSHLSEVFANVKANYRAEIQKYMNKKQQRGSFSFSPLGGNGKTLSVLLSSNSKLYGDIGRKVFGIFAKDIRENNSDIYIVGKVGKELFDFNKIEKKYRYIDFPETKEDEVKLGTFFQELESYETVNVYHGQFMNVLSQEALVSNVTGTSGMTPDKEGNPSVKFYFEPSLEAVLEIFENQIFVSLFKQTLHESELSHVASRIRQMENALENIGEYEKKLSRIQRKLHKRVEDSKQIQRISGMRLWK